MDGDRKISPSVPGLSPPSAGRMRSFSDPTHDRGTPAEADLFGPAIGESPGAVAVAIAGQFPREADAPARAEIAARVAARLVAAASHLTAAQRTAAMQALVAGAGGWREAFEALARAGESLSPPVIRDLMAGVAEGLGGRHLAAATRSELVATVVRATALDASPGLAPVPAAACVEAVLSTFGLASAGPALRQACLDDVLEAFASVPRGDMEDGTLTALVEAYGLALELDGQGRDLRGWLFDALAEAASAGRLDADGLGEAIEGLSEAAAGGDAGSGLGPWLLARTLEARAQVQGDRFVAMVAACVLAQARPTLQVEMAHALCGQALAAAPQLEAQALHDALRGLAEGICDATQADFDAPVQLAAPHPFERAVLGRVLMHLPMLAPPQREAALAGVLAGFQGSEPDEAQVGAARQALVDVLARHLPGLSAEPAAAVVRTALQVLGIEAGDGPATARFAQEVLALSLSRAPHLVLVSIDRLVAALGGAPVPPDVGGALLQVVLAPQAPLAAEPRAEAVQAVVEAVGGVDLTLPALGMLVQRLAGAAPALGDEACLAAMQGLGLGLAGPAMPLPLRERLVTWLATLPATTERATVTLLMEGLATSLDAADSPHLQAWLAARLPPAGGGAQGLRRLDLAIGLDRAIHPFEDDAVAHRRRVDLLMDMGEGAEDADDAGAAGGAPGRPGREPGAGTQDRKHPRRPGA